MPGGAFRPTPYLLGGQPSIGDYGLLGPLFAHLGRDPVPAGIMKRRAPKVFRWVERMNAPDPDLPEYGAYPASYLPEDELPDTLPPVLAQAAAELLPELTDKLAMLNAHVADRCPNDGEPVSARPHQRTIGTVDTHFRGAHHASGVQPYMLFLWQRVTGAFNRLDKNGQASVRAVMTRVGLDALLDARSSVRVERRNHVEVSAVPPRQAET